MPQSNEVIPFIRIGAVLLIVATLYLAQDILIPLALAMLLSFVLAPLGTRLEKWRLPRLPSVIIVAALAFAILAGVGSVVSNQVLELAESLPKYRYNIEQRLESLQGIGTGVLGRAADMLGEVRKEVKEEQRRKSARRDADKTPAGDPPATPEGKRDVQRNFEREPPQPLTGRGGNGGDDKKAPREPVAVRVMEPPPAALDLLQNYIGPLLRPVAIAGIVVIFVIFMLMQRDDLRDRVVRVAGANRLALTTRALDEAGSRISRYLLMQLVINASYGVPVGIGLWLLGVPGAVLWGLLAIMLRFIPFIGPWIAALPPVILSLAVFDGWVWPLLVVGLYVVLELFSNNVMEPWLYGESTGMSPMAVLLAAVFWSWLWGGAGLLLAVPLTASLVVLGKFIPHLEFFSILLGNEPALSPGERLYQRLLAGDGEGALALAEEYRQKHGLIGLYDRMIMQALNQEEYDRHHSTLDPQRQQIVRQRLKALIETMEDWREPVPESTPDSGLPPVLCLAARDEADALSARLLTQLLNRQGVAAEHAGAASRLGDLAGRIKDSGAGLICVSAMPPAAVEPACELCQRLSREFPRLKIMVGLWDAAASQASAIERLTEAGADQVVTTFEGGIAHARRMLQVSKP